MRFLFITSMANTLALAMRVQEEGHQVRFYIHDPAERETGDGLVEKVDDWQKHIDWADVIVFDDVYMKIKGAGVYGGGNWAQKLRAQGYNVVGGSTATDMLENDRVFGQETLQLWGVDTVPYEHFTSFDDAIKFVNEKGGAWAIKHEGQQSRFLNTVCWSAEETIAFLKWSKLVWNKYGQGKPDFILQQAVKGIEIAVSAWFDGRDFASACYVNREYKKQMPGDYGFSTGQTGEVGVAVNYPKLFKETLGKMKQFLASSGYKGFIDINCIVTDDGRAIPLEFTSRFGYPTIYSILALCQNPVSNVLAGKEHPDLRGYAVTLRLWTNGYPQPSENNADFWIWIPATSKKAIYFESIKVPSEKERQDMQLSGYELYRGAGESGVACVVVGTGTNIKEAREKCFAVAEKIKLLPYKGMRIDVGGECVEKEWEELQRRGWF